MHIRIKALAATALLVAGSLAWASPAAAADSHTCFTYKGSFKTGTTIKYADFNFDGSTDECFGIAPDRTIWHAWQGSGGWREMPGNGRADDMYAAYVPFPYDIGYRKVVVYVANPKSYWASEYFPPSEGNGWSGWYRCLATCNELDPDTAQP